VTFTTKVCLLRADLLLSMILLIKEENNMFHVNSSEINIRTSISPGCHLSLERRDRKNLSINANQCLLNREKLIHCSWHTDVYACCVKQTSIKCCLLLSQKRENERRTMTMMINNLTILSRDIQQTLFTYQMMRKRMLHQKSMYTSGNVVYR
jgi:hypothetical protein